MQERRTKIVATVGPASAGEDRLRELARAGVDVFRLNFSHGTVAEHLRVIRTIRSIEEELGRAIGILQDLCGPKIRLGTLPPEGIRLEAGRTILLVPGEDAPDGMLPVGYPHLLEDVEPGDPILLADGTVELRVLGRVEGALEARVVTGGRLTSHKGVNLPASRLRVAAVTPKDRADLEAGLEAGVDFVALSFVRDPSDVVPVLERLENLRARPMVIAKIEKPEAVRRLDAILELVDGIMVARGDLGVEMPAEEVPMIQKKIIAASRAAARPVITATQMLRSMVESPRPTRAETSDVANAILDGTDAVMLSEETAVGRHPVEAVRVLDRIARAVEPELVWEGHLDEPISESVALPAGAISRAACWLARDVGAGFIVASTTGGSTARLVSRFRAPFPVLGLSPHVEVRRQLQLSWGVIPVPMEPVGGADVLFDRVREAARLRGIAPGTRIVVTAGIPLNVPGTTNLVHVLEV